ncbi:hypothetical protein Hanom_Chr11g00984981 [Helianthus anomalus]
MPLNRTFNYVTGNINRGIPLWSSTSRYIKCPRCMGVLPEPPDSVTPQRVDEGSSGKQVENVFIDQEAGSNSKSTISD